MTTVVLAADAELPLTCTRLGTCCHGKVVWVNPYEVATLAQARGVDAATFRAQAMRAGGARLRFDGPPGWRGLNACSQYDPARGCRAHAGRPLACRLYPLGRERRGDAVSYVHDGPEFPCLAGCPGVVDLPKRRVADYLADQGVATLEAINDAYLEVVQDLAEGAFVLWFDSGLAASGDRATLPRWRRLVAMDADERAAAIPGDWLDLLMTPPIAELADGIAFVRAHAASLQQRAQSTFATLRDPGPLRDASCLMLALGLQLAQSLGAEVGVLGERWLATASAQGARE